MRQDNEYLSKVWKKTLSKTDREYAGEARNLQAQRPAYAYQKLPGIFPAGKSEYVQPEQDNEKLAQIWRNSANKTWDEYLDTVDNSHILRHQAIPSKQNDESKKRMEAYLEKYKHLIGDKTRYE